MQIHSCAHWRIAGRMPAPQEENNISAEVECTQMY